MAISILYRFRLVEEHMHAGKEFVTKNSVVSIRKLVTPTDA